MTEVRPSNNNSVLQVEQSLRALETSVLKNSALSPIVWDKHVQSVCQCFQEVHGSKVSRAQMVSWTKRVDVLCEKMMDHGKSLRRQQLEPSQELISVVSTLEKLDELLQQLVSTVVADSLKN